MALIRKLYLVKKEASAPWIARHEELERDFARRISALTPGVNGVTIDNYAARNMDIIQSHNASVQELCRGFVIENGISDTLSGNESGKPAFESMFTWDIICSIHSKRMFIEACSSTQDMFPIRKSYPFLTEIDESRYMMLSGRKEM